jgi:hypothetical protein
MNENTVPEKKETKNREYRTGDNRGNRGGYRFACALFSPFPPV